MTPCDVLSPTIIESHGVRTETFVKDIKFILISFPSLSRFHPLSLVRRYTPIDILTGLLVGSIVLSTIS